MKGMKMSNKEDWVIVAQFEEDVAVLATDFSGTTEELQEWMDEQLANGAAETFAVMPKKLLAEIWADAEEYGRSFQ